MKLLDYFKSFTDRQRLQAASINGTVVLPVEKGGVTFWVTLSDLATYIGNVSGDQIDAAFVLGMAVCYTQAQPEVTTGQKLLARNNIGAQEATTSLTTLGALSSVTNLVTLANLASVAGLQALEGLPDTPGLIEQTAANTYAIRPVGVSTPNSVLKVGDADLRYMPSADGSSVIVRDSGNAVTNGTALRAAYSAAKNLAPNGGALSATNRATVILWPGTYDLGTLRLAMDAEFVDVIGVSGNPEQVLITSQITAASSGTIYSSVSNLRLKGLTIDRTGTPGGAGSTMTSSWFFTTQNLYTVVEDCIFKNTGGGRCMRTDASFTGKYIRCVSGDYSFGSSTTAGVLSITGYYEDCVAGNYSFGGSDNSGMILMSLTSPSGAVRCRSGSNSFGSSALGAVICSGLFTQCSAKEKSFGYSGASTANVGGELYDCRAGYNSFGSGVTSVIVTGCFMNCLALYNSFGYASGGWVQLAGGCVIANCTAGDYSFGYEATPAVPPMPSDVVISNCSAGSHSFFPNGVHGSDTSAIAGCVAGDNSFGTATGGIKVYDAAWSRLLGDPPALAAHASSHAVAGSDPLSLSDIGGAPAKYWTCPPTPYSVQQIYIANATGTCAVGGTILVAIGSDNIMSVGAYIEITAGQTAAQWGTAVREALAATEAVTDLAAVDGAGAMIRFVRNRDESGVAYENEPTLAVSVDYGTATGISLSGSTAVPGVAGAGGPGDFKGQLFYDYSALPLVNAWSWNGTGWVQVFDRSAYDPEGAAADAETAAKSYADGLVVGLVDDRGNFNASVNTFPTTGGSGTASAIMKGDLWLISVVATSGPLLGIPVGSSVRALVNTPGQDAGNWAITEVGIGYTPEDVGHKSSTIEADKASTTKYPQLKAMYDWAVVKFASAAQGLLAGTAMQPDLPAMLVMGSGDSLNVYLAKAIDQTGKLITVAHTEPYGTPYVSVGVAGNAITVTPGSKARMTCVGGHPGMDGVVMSYGGGNVWTSPNPNGSYRTEISGGSEEWMFYHHTPTSGPYSLYSNSEAENPDGIPASAWFTDESYEEQAVYFACSASASTAEQVSAAVNAYAPASALVTASGSGDGTAVTQGATHLAGVSFDHSDTHKTTGTDPLAPSDIGAASKRQYKKASFTAEAYGRYHVKGSATADGSVLVTDPTSPAPVEGDIFDVTIAGGWVRVGGVDRQQSQFVIEREFDGSAWVTLDANLSVVLNANGGATSAGLTLTEVLGSEKVADPHFGTTGSWTKGADWTVASSKATHETGTVGSLVPNPALTAAIGTVYKIQLVFTALSVGGLMTLVFGGVTTTYTLPTGAQTFTCYVKATATTGFSLAMATAVRCDVDSMTIKPVTAGGAIGGGLIQHPTGESHLYADAAAKDAHRAAMGVGTGDSVVFAAVTSNGGLTTAGTVTLGTGTTFGTPGTGVAALFQAAFGVLAASGGTATNITVTNYTETPVAIGTVTTTNTIELTNGTFQTVTLTASTACTFTMPTATAGKSFVLLLKQAASTGNGSATFTGVDWGAAGSYAATATAGKMDILSFVADGSKWFGSYTKGYTP